MKKEIIGILICTLLIFVAVAPVINALTIEKNEINEVSESERIVNNNIKLNTPRPTPFPPDDSTVWIGFGRIYNLGAAGGCQCFNCANVMCITRDGAWHHYTNGEVLCIDNYNHLFGIVTDNFFFII